MKKENKLIVISICMLIGLWQAVSMLIDNNLIFPSIPNVINRLLEILKNSELVFSILSSIYRCLLATAISATIAIIIGFLSYKNKYIYNFLYPVFTVIRALPTMAFIVMALIWFSKEYAPILIGILISLPIFYDIILNSLNDIGTKIIDMCNIYKVSRKKILIDIYGIAILLALTNVLSSTISLVFKVIIAGELYSQPKYGIGAAIQFEKMQLNTDSIIAWIVIVTFVSYIFDKILYLLKAKYKNFEGVE